MQIELKAELKYFCNILLTATQCAIAANSFIIFHYLLTPHWLFEDFIILIGGFFSLPDFYWLIKLVRLLGLHRQQQHYIL